MLGLEIGELLALAGTLIFTVGIPRIFYAGMRMRGKFISLEDWSNLQENIQRQMNTLAAQQQRSMEAQMRLTFKSFYDDIKNLKTSVDDMKHIFGGVKTNLEKMEDMNSKLEMLERKQRVIERSLGITADEEIKRKL